MSLYTTTTVRPRRTTESRRPRHEPMARPASKLNRLHDNAVVPLKKKLPIKKLALSLILLCSAAIAAIWLQLQIDSMTVRVAELQQTRDNLASRNRILQQEIDEAITFDEIYEIVNSRYGMDMREPVLLEVPDDVLSGTTKR